MTEAQSTLPISIADIEAAAARIDGSTMRTPLLESPLLNDVVGGRILMKAECLQTTGSFKLRGATNYLAAMDPGLRAAGVVTHSSGNHGQALAMAAQRFGVPASIVVPDDAPPLKARLIADWGARVIRCARADRDRIAAEVVAETGGTLVPPYDHPLVMAGQGTTGLEIAAQCATLGVRPDRICVCSGGGGLTAGIAVAVADRMPGVPVYGVEPEEHDDIARSLAKGERVRNDPGGSLLCDALAAPTPGVLTFPVLQQHVHGVVAVSDAQVMAAMATAFLYAKVVLEPGGAVALASVLSGVVESTGVTVVTLSGGNVEPEVFARALKDE